MDKKKHHHHHHHSSSEAPDQKINGWLARINHCIYLQNLLIWKKVKDSCNESIQHMMSHLTSLESILTKMAAREGEMRKLIMVVSHHQALSQDLKQQVEIVEKRNSKLQHLVTDYNSLVASLEAMGNKLPVPKSILMHAEEQNDLVNGLRKSTEIMGKVAETVEESKVRDAARMCKEDLEAAAEQIDDVLQCKQLLQQSDNVTSDAFSYLMKDTLGHATEFNVPSKFYLDML